MLILSMGFGFLFFYYLFFHLKEIFLKLQILVSDLSFSFQIVWKSTHLSNAIFELFYAIYPEVTNHIIEIKRECLIIKKRVLFIINNLKCGGAEKALINLLNQFDYSSYKVDLYLFERDGIFLKQIPDQVHIINSPSHFKYFDMPIEKVIKSCLTKKEYQILFSRIMVGLTFKLERNSARCEQLIWPHIARNLKTLEHSYDIAIGFLEKTPIYFCVDKVKATKKIGWIHTDYERLGMDPQMDFKYFNKLDHIISVSEESVKVLKTIFPIFKYKIKLIQNIIDPISIKKLASEKIDIKKRCINVVSVGRLHPSKGFDLAINACKLLVHDGYDIKWKIVGEGQERSKLDSLIKYEKLQENIELIGQKENPYPYMLNCDIYVQTSLFEGQGLTITEAKVLNKPIVATNFDAIYNQLVNNKTGLIVEKNPYSIYEGVRRLIEDENLREVLKSNLEKENFHNRSEIEKLYELLAN